MQLNEYQVLAHKTANTNLDRNTALLVAALGLVDEAIEVLALFDVMRPDAGAMRKELGDVYWYDAELCTLLGIQMADVASPPLGQTVVSPYVLAEKLCIAAKDVGELIKKHVGHGHDLPLDRLVTVLRSTSLYLADLSNFVGGTSSVLQANIDKLRARYPEGFATEASVNRVDTVDAIAHHVEHTILGTWPDWAEGEGRNA